MILKKDEKLQIFIIKNIKNNKLVLPIENKSNYHSYYVYVVRAKNRTKFTDYLKKNKIL